MPRLLVVFVLLLISCVARVHAELELIEHSTSPDRKFAFASEDAPGNGGTRLWLVLLPAVATVGLPLPADDFLGIPSQGESIWNPKAHRVAIVQGGRPWSKTRVFQYSRASLSELPLPDLAGLPERWFTGAVRFSRRYVCAVRWLNENRLEFSISGTVIYHDGKAEADFHEYDLRTVVNLDAAGSRIVKVREHE